MTGGPSEGEGLTVVKGSPFNDVDVGTRAGGDGAVPTIVDALIETTGVEILEVIHNGSVALGGRGKGEEGVGGGGMSDGK